MRTYLYGGSFNPIGIHHYYIILRILDLMADDDELVLVPCGIRTDGKESVNDTETVHRAAMLLITAAVINDPRLKVDLSDLERDAFERAWDTIKRYEKSGREVWYTIGGDQIRSKDGNHPLREVWYRGENLFQSANFLIVQRPGYRFEHGDLPPNHRLIDFVHDGSSTEIRQRAFLREEIEGLVIPEVEAYIQRHHLYTGRPILGPTTMQLDGNAHVIIAPPPPDPDDIDPEREERKRLLREMVLRVYQDRKQLPVDHVIVIGGDGPMLHSIQDRHRLRLPFLGLNAGTRGFLLNDGTIAELEARLRRGKVYVYRQPLLHGQFETMDGEWRERLAFNELFVQATNGHSGSMRVTIDDVTRFAQLDGDGLMLSTAAGSTGWSRSYGGVPIIIGTPQLVLTGVGVASGMHLWRSAPIPIGAKVEIELMQTSKRPMHLRIDGRKTDLVRRVRMHASRVHSAELAFFPETDLAKKHMLLHFPG